MPIEIIGGGGVTAGQLAAAVQPAFRSGGTVYYCPRYAAGANTVLVQDTLYAMPFYVPSTTTFVSIGVITTGVASSAARLGIYVDGGGVPGALSLDAGSVTTTAAGFQSASISKLLTAGWYWLAAAVQGAAGNLYSSGANGSIGVVGTTAPFSTGPVSGYSQTGVSGALPSPWGGTLTAASACPAVWIAAQ